MSAAPRLLVSGVVLGQPMGGVRRHNAELLPRLAERLRAAGGGLGVLEGAVPIPFELPDVVERIPSNVPFQPPHMRALASRARSARPSPRRRPPAGPSTSCTRPTRPRREPRRPGHVDGPRPAQHRPRARSSSGGSSAMLRRAFDGARAVGRATGWPLAWSRNGPPWRGACTSSGTAPITCRSCRAGPRTPDSRCTSDTSSRARVSRPWCGASAIRGVRPASSSRAGRSCESSTGSGGSPSSSARRTGSSTSPRRTTRPSRSSRRRAGRRLPIAPRGLGDRPLEALRGCPTAVSDIPAHREVAGPGAARFEVGDVTGSSTRWTGAAAPSSRRGAADLGQRC